MFRTLILDYVKSLAQQTLQKIFWIHDLEKVPMTLNEHYYSDYEDKFLAHFRGWRSENRDAPWVQHLKLIAVNKDAKPREDDSVESHVQRVLQGFNGLGVHGVKPMDLPKVLPPDPFETALKIMASVRAYFQGQVFCSNLAIFNSLTV